jgi:enoyl-CoA hydratase
MSVRYEVADDHIVLVTIDRPERMNALDLAHMDALAGCWERFRDDDDAWAAVLTGVGKSFSAGADLKDYAPIQKDVRRLLSEGVKELDGHRLDAGFIAVLRGVEMYKPIVAAVNGYCLAGGMELLGATDIRIAGESATFGVIEPRRGLFAGGGTTARLPRQLCWPAAMELLLTGEKVPASRALQLGLLNEVVPDDQVVERALEWARIIRLNAPLAVRATKESALRGLAAGSLAEAYAIEDELARRIAPTDDAREGPRAFIEKRDPVWTGR